MSFRAALSCAAAVLWLLASWTAPAAPSESVVQLDLPAQSLADALREVGRATGTNLLFDPLLVARHRTEPLRAKLTVNEALARLLQGTPIRYEFLTERTVVLSATEAPRASETAASATSRSGRDGALSAANVANGSERSDSGMRSPRAGSTLEEVVVTAEKRSGLLLEVPMSISVVTAAMLDSQGANSLRDIAAFVPGMSIVEQSPGLSRVQLRGVSALNGAPTVGLYLDELPLNVEGGFPAYGADIRLLDMERIEVLRGPQGTLYGEGSMGGTIKYVTRAPDLDGASFGIDTALASVTDGTALYRASAVADMPVVPGIYGVRLVAGYERSPGWLDYPRVGNDVNQGEAKTARLTSLWEPGDAFEARLLLLYQDTVADSMHLGDVARSGDFVLRQPTRDINRAGNLLLEYDAGHFTLLSSTSYMRRHSRQVVDFTAFLAPRYEALGVPAGAVARVPGAQSATFEGPSQELRIASSGAGPLSWTAGMYYRDYEERITMRTTATPNPLAAEIIDARTVRESRQSALFADVGYEVAPAVEIRTGVRYMRERRTEAGVSNSLGAPGANDKRQAEFTSTNPRLVLSYRPSQDALIYASAAKGFRSGGLNNLSARPPGCTLPADFGPEKLWTYELGGNLSAWRGLAILQAAVYYNDWGNIQTLEYCPGSVFTQITNLGRATGGGVDLQLTLRPSADLTLALSAGYNDSQYEDTSAAHRKGDSIDFVPELTASVVGDYDFLWAAGLPGRLHVSYQHTDSFSIVQRNLGSATKSDAYGRLDATLSILYGQWEIAAFGHNLTDVSADLAPAYAAYLAPISMQPRTIGIAVRYSL